MFYIRQSKPEDAATFLKLARMVSFINLPPDEKIISSKIRYSQHCFTHAAGGKPKDRASRGGNAHAGYAASQDESDLFMFTIMDRESNSPVGTSQVRAHMGGPDNPNFSFRLEERHFFSPSLNLGTRHAVVKLFADPTGPTEVGGLILQPSFRGHRLRPGRLISLVRFHFMGLHRSLFADRVIAEMMPPITPEGDNLFWDHVGRKFIPVKYIEADRFCQYNRSFIHDLLPKEELYLTLLPLEVMNSVAQVSAETVPARRMLENLGFAYKGLIDPFDGGPHLEAMTDEIATVATTRKGKLGEPAAASKLPLRGIVSVLTKDGEFRAVETAYSIEAGSGGGVIRVPPEEFELLGNTQAAKAGCTPLESPSQVDSTRTPRARVPRAAGKPKKARA